MWKKYEAVKARQEWAFVEFDLQTLPFFSSERQLFCLCCLQFSLFFNSILFLVLSLDHKQTGFQKEKKEEMMYLWFMEQAKTVWWAEEAGEHTTSWVHLNLQVHYEALCVCVCVHVCMSVKAVYKCMSVQSLGSCSSAPTHHRMSIKLYLSQQPGCWCVIQSVGWIHIEKSALIIR